ncbi:hypothetical protein GCM10027444_30690 [Actinopolyspora lacussalsi]
MARDVAEEKQRLPDGAPGAMAGTHAQPLNKGTVVLRVAYRDAGRRARRIRQSEHAW